MGGTVRQFVFIFLFIISGITSYSQTEIPVMSYANPGEYVIDGITVTGVYYIDPNVVISLSGLAVGDKITIPGEAITNAIKKFWSQGLFSEASIVATDIIDDRIYLNIELKERPRLGRMSLIGVKKTETTDLMDKLKIRSGSQVTDDVLNNITNIIKKHYTEKGYFNTEVRIVQSIDTSQMNRVNLRVYVTKNSKVKISKIIFTGNQEFTSRTLRKKLKKTKQIDLNIFKGSKYIKADYAEDKTKLIDFYNEQGYRDAKILSDSISRVSENRINLYLNLQEGHKYYFRKITWVGNTKYPSLFLAQVLGIVKGDTYNQTRLNKRLSEADDAVNNLYLDNGYLFYNLTPVETAIENDSIDLEMRIYEGKQATINKIIINGNTKTNEHVVRREIRTIPGELFSRSEIIRTVRELATLGHFDPEKIVPNPLPNPADGTVDIQFDLEEKANDQLEVSGGWGAGMLVGTIGLRFANFSIRNVPHFKAWRPVPTGDGQTLSVRAQSNGSYYRSYNISFIEPWFGGKKPNSFSVSFYNSKYSNGYWSRGKYQKAEGYMSISGGAIGFGKRLKWPDDFFTFYSEISYQRYNLHKYSGYFSLFSDGQANNISFTTTIGRNSVSAPIYPRNGSNFSLSMQVTPPYSLLNPGRNYSTLEPEAKYKWVEYYKWSFKSEYYINLIEKLVFMTKAQFGFKGFYNPEIGNAPFEGYYVGGDGMIGYNMYGFEVIPLRGYTNSYQYGSRSVTGGITPPKGANLYDKFTMELRYPISLNPQATVFGLLFAEAGNAWTTLDQFSPFQLRRSLGVGMRAFLPMFGMLGIDWGYGFDNIPWNPGGNKSQFHFTIGQQF
jgi:outer membrane protein insertion porin family